jgi:hypothetical protein
MPGISRRDLAAETAGREPRGIGRGRTRSWLRGAVGPPRYTRKISMELKETVREKYREAALRVTSGGGSCCGSAPSSLGCVDPIALNGDPNESAHEVREPR